MSRMFPLHMHVLRCRVPLVLEDLGSTNGTMVNGHIIEQPVTLRENDEVQVGDVIMRVGRR